LWSTHPSASSRRKGAIRMRDHNAERGDVPHPVYGPMHWAAARAISECWESVGAHWRVNSTAVFTTP
jgi:hypothetical protein